MNLPKFSERPRLSYGARVTAATKLGIARSLLVDANAALHNDDLRRAIALVCEAIDDEEPDAMDEPGGRR